LQRYHSLLRHIKIQVHNKNIQKQRTTK